MASNHMLIRSPIMHYKHSRLLDKEVLMWCTLELLLMDFYVTRIFEKNVTLIFISECESILVETLARNGPCSCSTVIK